MKKKVSIFRYTDYRTFLADWFREAKGNNPSFSHRAFAQLAGFHSSNFLMLVMQGKRNLTEESLRQMLSGLRLGKQEQEFFRNLVLFNQAKTHSERNLSYKKLLQSRGYQKLRPIERKEYEYYSTWYHPVVRELVVSKACDGTPEWVAAHINPPITPDQAKRSIRLLESLGFIEQSGPGRWRQADTIISTGPEVQSVVIHNYHKALLDLSKHMMDRISMRHRDVSAITVGVKRERIAEIKKRIIDFRREILELVSGDEEPEEVAQLNIQFFPVTRGMEQGDEGP